ncbi:MAG: hypothetical protein ACLTUL_03130 [Blautia faecis]
MSRSLSLWMIRAFLIWNDDKKYKGVLGDIKALVQFSSHLWGFKKEDSEELARITMWNFPQ